MESAWASLNVPAFQGGRVELRNNNYTGKIIFWLIWHSQTRIKSPRAPSNQPLNRIITADEKGKREGKRRIVRVLLKWQWFMRNCSLVKNEFIIYLNATHSNADNLFPSPIAYLMSCVASGEETSTWKFHLKLISYFCVIWTGIWISKEIKFSSLCTLSMMRERDWFFFWRQG